MHFNLHLDPVQFGTDRAEFVSLLCGTSKMKSRWTVAMPAATVEWNVSRASIRHGNKLWLFHHIRQQIKTLSLRFMRGRYTIVKESAAGILRVLENGCSCSVRSFVFADSSSNSQGILMNFFLLSQPAVEGTVELAIFPKNAAFHCAVPTVGTLPELGAARFERRR